MARPIVVSEELREKITQGFLAQLANYRMPDGKFTYETTLRYDQTYRATVVFSHLAFAKMSRLLMAFTTEVAWHGLVHRDEDDPSVFHIDDILVYPQMVTGTNVETDQNRYQDFLDALDDDAFNRLRMQGHSHVNFSPTPSGTDLSHQERIISQLRGDHFYIFMIFNKSFERNIKIYDYPNNTLYENFDIDVRIGDVALDLDAFIKDAQNTVQKAGYTYNNGNTGYGKYQDKYDKPATTPAASTYKKTKTKVVTGGYTIPQSPINQQPAGITNENHFSHSGYGPDYDAWGD